MISKRYWKAQIKFKLYIAKQNQVKLSTPPHTTINLVNSIAQQVNFGSVMLNNYIIRDQIMTLPYHSKHYIKNNKNSQDFQCSICFSFDCQMMQCTGPCRSKYCIECVSKERTKSCLKQCSKYCKLKPLLHANLQFYCPFQAEECKQIIASPNQFERHLADCSFATKQSKEQQLYKQNYKCRYGHPLIFIESNNFFEIYRGYRSQYQTTLGETCSFCCQQWLSKSVCLLCGVGNQMKVYCIICRPIPCDRERCPLGHEFSIQHHDSGITCDFCGIQASIYGSKCYSDRECNFDICNNCYQVLPLKNPLTPLKNQLPSFYCKEQERTDIDD